MANLKMKVNLSRMMDYMWVTSMCSLISKAKKVWYKLRAKFSCKITMLKRCYQAYLDSRLPMRYCWKNMLLTKEVLANRDGSLSMR